jgi:large subunit ribosomal protein L2
MKLKNQKPFTPSQRHLIQLSTKHLKKKPLIKHKLKGLINSSGRNNSGRITIRHKGCGHKKRYRKIDFYRQTDFIGIIIGIEYDPNRNANVASVYSLSFNNYLYILAPKNLKTGDIIKSGSNIEAKLGNSLPISEIPVGSFIHNVSTKQKKPGQISRSAGTFSQLKEKSLNYAKIELSSGEQRLVSAKCYATIGIVSNELFNLTQKGKAGRSRWLNTRPTVRGVAMNPIDHPHGGGEGKKSGKGKTPWGKPTKKGKTGKKREKL